MYFNIVDYILQKNVFDAGCFIYCYSLPFDVIIPTNIDNIDFVCFRHKTYNHIDTRKTFLDQTSLIREQLNQTRWKIANLIANNPELYNYLLTNDPKLYRRDLKPLIIMYNASTKRTWGLQDALYDYNFILLSYVSELLFLSYKTGIKLCLV